MVHAHAVLAGLRSERPTDDADLVVEIRAPGQYQQAANVLAELGFHHHAALDPKTPSYRFVREAGEIIDLMVTDQSQPVRFMRRPVLQVPASRSAMKSVEPAVTPAGTEFPVPTLAGALALKGAAAGTSTPNRIRHFQDGVVLLACADVRGLGGLSKSQREHVNRLIKGLGSPEAWSTSSSEVQLRARRALRTVRPDWIAPSFLTR